MKTIRDIINSIPDKDIQKWIYENIDKSGVVISLGLEYNSPEYRPYNFLDVLFSWQSTRQGHEFWRRISHCRNLLEEMPQIKTEFPYLFVSEKLSIKEKVFDFLDAHWGIKYTAEDLSKEVHENVDEVRQALMELAPTLSIRIETYYSYTGYKINNTCTVEKSEN